MVRLSSVDGVSGSVQLLRNRFHIDRFPEKRFQYFGDGAIGDQQGT